jgi:hypothetical protein
MKPDFTQPAIFIVKIGGALFGPVLKLRDFFEQVALR